MAEQVRRIPLLPPSEQNPRNSEGAFVRLKDGRVLFVYSHFYGGGADHAAAYLAGRYSDNGGRTWTQEDVMILENEGGCNIMSVSLMRMANDDIGLFYLRKDHEVKLCRGFLRRSTDEGETWSDAVLCTPRRAYNVVNNDRVVALASGRLLMPASLHFPVEDGEKRRPGRATCYLSDDDGLSWEHASTQIEPPQGSVAGLQEPCVIELQDGRVMMLARTDMGCHYRAYSEDGGIHWSEAEPTDIITRCVSPASIRRIPQTGDILIVYTDHSHLPPDAKAKRTPLVTAISRDEGRSWEQHKVLEDDPDGCYCYTAIHFLDDDDAVLLAHCAGQYATGGLNLTQITRVPVQWLYS